MGGRKSTGTHINCGGRHALNLHQVQTQDPADDIDERIDYTNLMEVYLRRFDPMGLALGLSQPVEHCLALFFYNRGQSAFEQNPFDLRQRQWRPKTFFDQHVDFRRGDRPSLHPLLREAKPLDRQSGKTTDQLLEGQSCVHQRAQNHVAADA